MAKQILYIFNPEHDLALASGEANYMPPASARRMASELALLPAWYAEEGSAVLAPSAYNLDYLRQMQQILPLPVSLLTAPELSAAPHWDVRPWGWDAALRKRLAGWGMDEASLPDAGWLGTLRASSHRSVAVELLPELRLGDCFCGESHLLYTPDEWKSFVEGRSECLLKAPLSGSGKGLNWCKGAFTPFIAGWCARVSASQGGVVAEPIYNKVEDFAMEFFADGAGEVRFVGYSVFRTGRNGMYEGNLLLSDEAAEERLAGYVPQQELVRLKRCLADRLARRVGAFYKGYLGVDMMICRFVESGGPTYRIHPCVEVNLRMNMGVVAHLLYERYVHPCAVGDFRIAYHPAEGEALKEHDRMSEAFPLEIRDGKVAGGYLSLVPVHKKSCYRAWMLVGGEQEA